MRFEAHGVTYTLTKTCLKLRVFRERRRGITWLLTLRRFDSFDILVTRKERLRTFMLSPY